MDEGAGRVSYRLVFTDGEVVARGFITVDDAEAWAIDNLDDADYDRARIVVEPARKRVRAE